MYNCRKCGADIYPSENQIAKKDFVCRGCRNEYWRNYRNKRKENGNPIIPVKMDSGYYADYRIKNLDTIRASQRVLQKKYRNDPGQKHKHKARWIVNKAIKSGVLVKQPCSVCASMRSEAHHEDYSKPLEVVWYCRKHHKEHHNKSKTQ